MHVPLGLWLAVAAAIALVVGSTLAGLWRLADLEARGRVALGLSLWLAADVVLAGLGVFAATAHRVVPFIALGIVTPVVVGVWLMRRPSSLRRVLESLSVRSLIAVQTYRVAGVVFLVAWADGRLPAIFALPAGLGDVAVGLSAAWVAVRVDDGMARSRRRAVVWNLCGIGDLVVAVTLGALTSPTPLWPDALGASNPLVSRIPFVLIPVFAVPLSVLLHVATLRRLAVPSTRSVHEDPRPVAA